MSGKQMKRVGIDAHMLGDHSGGNETYYRNILENMEVPEGMEIYVFVTKRADISKIKEKFNIVYFSEHGAGYRNFIELPMLCIIYKLDLLHVQYFIPFFRPCKVVTTIHDICFEHYKDIFTRREYIRQKLLIPYAAKKSKLIFTVSEFAKKDIANCYGIDTKKIVVTYNGVGKEFKKLTETEIDRDGLKKQFGINDNYILTVGNIQPRKNLVGLIKAFTLLKEEYNDECFAANDTITDSLQLVVVGKKAWMYEDIFEEAQKIKQYIVFTDYVDLRELIRLYNGARCLVFPSLYEGFGLPPVEAIACGTPVAVSNTSCLPEVVGDNGVYFEPENVSDIKTKIYQLLTKENCVQNAPVKLFNWYESSNKLIEAYKGVLNA